VKERGARRSHSSAPLLLVANGLRILACLAASHAGGAAANAEERLPERAP